MNELEQLLSEARAATEAPTVPFGTLQRIDRALLALPSAATPWAGAAFPHPAAVVAGMKLGGSGWLLATIAAGTVGALAAGGLGSGRPSPAHPAQQGQTMCAPSAPSDHHPIAAETTVVAQAEPAPRVIYRSTTVIDFTGESVFGDLQRPAMDVIFSPPKVSFPTMVKVRKNFQDELIRSADNL
jgi:hypothetical protein